MIDVGTEIKEVDLRDNSLPWEKKELPQDKTGIRRIIFDVTLRELGINTDLRLPLLFKHPEDEIKNSDIGGKTFVIRRNLNSLLKLINYYWKIPLTEEMKAFSSESIPRPKSFDYRFLDALAACSLFDAEGNIKDFNDNEGWMLLTAYAITSQMVPNESARFKQLLFDRIRFLKFDDELEKSRQPIQSILAEKPSWGNVAFDKIWVVHTTDYLPRVGGDKIAILPRIDSDGVPRWTIHTFANGVVEEHTNGISTASWERKKFAIAINFAEAVKDPEIGMPITTFQADTFWSLKPGQGLKLPQGSFIIAPEEDINSQFVRSLQKNGVELNYYSATDSSIRDAVKQEFAKRQIPFINGISASDASDADWRFAKQLGTSAKTHFQLRPYSDIENMLIYTANIAYREAKTLAQQSGILTDKEAFRITGDGRLTNIAVHKPRSKALNFAIEAGRRQVLLNMGWLDDYARLSITREGLETALVSGVI